MFISYYMFRNDDSKYTTKDYYKSALVNHDFNHLAIGLKTGFETALTRVPLQLMTYLKDVRNVFIFSEAHMQVGEHQVYDVVSDLYKNGTEPHQWQEILKEIQSRIVPFTNPSKKSSEAELKADESRIGWKVDAHKNIPALKKMYEMYPHAKWFAMVDDDTYLDVYNLNDYLSHYDPKVPHYFGGQHVFVGCGGITKFGQLYFAHGGGGIFFSRAALEKMLPVYDRCLQEFKDCWAGDVRTALCMKEAGILLQHMTNLNSDPPNIAYSFPPDPCGKPITFHHLYPYQMQYLHQSNPKGLTYSDAFKAFQRINDVKSIDIGHDRIGHDFHNQPANTTEECIQLCENDSKCLSWSWTRNTCWLKDWISARKEQKDSVTGVLIHRYHCQQVHP